MARLAPRRPAVHASVAYRQILVPVDSGLHGALVIACALAAEHGASVTAIGVIEVPAALPLDAAMPETDLKDRLTVAEAIGDRYGVRVDRRVVRAREAREAIVEAAEESAADLIVLRRPFDRTAQYVLRHAACRVLLSAPRP